MMAVPILCLSALVAVVSAQDDAPVAAPVAPAVSPRVDATGLAPVAGAPGVATGRDISGLDGSSVKGGRIHIENAETSSI